MFSKPLTAHTAASSREDHVRGGRTVSQFLPAPGHWGGPLHYTPLLSNSPHCQAEKHKN